MTSDDLLAALKAHKLINETLAARLKRDSLIANESAESIIARERLVDDVKIAEMKSELLKVPYRKIDPASVDEKLFGLIPEETARTYGTIPLSLQDNLLIVGMLHPDDVKVQDAIKFIARQNHMNLGVYLVSWSDWDAVMKRYSPYRASIAKAVQSITSGEGESSQKKISLDDARGNEDAPVVKIVADTFREAVLSKASDIHIEPQENTVRIRFRNNGDLHIVASLPGALAQPIVSRVKVIASLKIDENRIPQDGRFRTKIFDRDIDFRVATLPTPLGEKVVIRVLDPTTGLKSFENLPLRFGAKETVQAGLEKPFGMVLIKGPTGSGKTTTLYAFLQTLNTEDVNVVSLEDPVEYFVAGINQSQVHPDIGYDFASGLRQILRQDPDVIMVGEIRDAETAGLAVQAALTGHVVLSTLHTNNAAGVIPRLMNMKVEPFLIPVAVNLMMAQRLVGKICPDCKFQEDPSPTLLHAIENALEGLQPEVREKYKPPFKVWHTHGCNTCKGKGIVDRTPIYEVFRMTPALEEIVASGATIQKIAKEAKAQGMITLRQDGILKALDGITLIEEVIRETEEV